MEDTLLLWSVEVEVRRWPRWPGGSMRRLAAAVREDDRIFRVIGTSNAPWLRLLPQLHPTIKVEVAAVRPREAGNAATRAVTDALGRLGRDGEPTASIISTDWRPAPG